MKKEQPYQVMPDLTAEEYEELKADIAERGVLVPIELDEEGNVLDGHHRLRACEELGITDYPAIIRRGLSEEDKLLHALKLNTARRSLTREQKAEAITQLLERSPQLSDRQIARAVGVTHPTVGKYRRQLNGEEVESFTIQDIQECAQKIRECAEGLMRIAESTDSILALMLIKEECAQLAKELRAITEYCDIRMAELSAA